MINIFKQSLVLVTFFVITSIGAVAQVVVSGGASRDSVSGTTRFNIITATPTSAVISTYDTLNNFQCLLVGGGGGGALDAKSASTTGNGGSGGYIKIIKSIATPITYNSLGITSGVIACSVGSGGAGATVSGPGASGGATTFATFSASGGLGGVTSTNANPVSVVGIFDSMSVTSSRNYGSSTASYGGGGAGAAGSGGNGLAAPSKTGGTGGAAYITPFLTLGRSYSAGGGGNAGGGSGGSGGTGRGGVVCGGNGATGSVAGGNANVGSYGSGGGGGTNTSGGSGAPGFLVIAYDAYDIYYNNGTSNVWRYGSSSPQSGIPLRLRGTTFTVTSGTTNWGTSGSNCGKALIEQGSTLTVAGGTLDLTGVLLNVQGTFNLSGGTITGGTIYFPGPQTTIQPGVYNNLILNNTPGTTYTLAGNVTITGTLTINSGNKLNLSGFTLTTNAFSGTGAVTGSSTSVLIYTGSSNSTLNMDQTGVQGNRTLKYLKLTSGAQLTLGNQLMIYGGSGNSGGDVELVRSPSASTLTTGGFLILKHSGSSTGHPIIGGLASISGSVSVEDYFAAGSRSYRQTGSVLSGGLPVTQITDDFDLYASNPNAVTDVNGFNLSSAGFTNPSLLLYNEASSPKWVPLIMSNSVQTISPGKGFAFFMRPTGSGAAGNYNDQIMDYSGAINNADVTLSNILTYSSISGGGIDGTNGYNLLANPYCSYLDLNQFFLNNTHLDPVIYKLNKSSRGHESYGLKAGVSLGLGAKWNKTSNTSTDLDPYLDPGDAFFVKLKTTTGGAAPSSTSVAFKLTQVVSSVPTKIGGLGQNKMEIDSLSYAALIVTMRFMNDSINSDAVKLVNSSIGGNEVVNTSLWDIYDMRSTCNELSLISANNDMLASKTLNSNKNWIVPMNVATCSKGKSYFDFSIDYNKPGMEATFELYDKYLKKNFTIVPGSRYEFEVSDIPQSFGSDRFYINMNNSILGVNSENVLGSFDLYPNPVSGASKIHVNLMSLEPGELEIRNLIGQTLLKEIFVANIGKLTVDLEPFSLTPGTYLISCKQKSGTTTKRVTIF